MSGWDVFDALAILRPRFVAELSSRANVFGYSSEAEASGKSVNCASHEGRPFVRSTINVLPDASVSGTPVSNSHPNQKTFALLLRSSTSSQLDKMSAS